MRPLSAEHRALLASQVAALRDAGLPAGKAVALVAAAVPEPGLKTTLEATAAALERGDGGGGVEGDPLLRLLALGERAGAGALRELAEAELDALESAETSRAVVGSVLALMATAVGMLSVLGWLVASLDFGTVTVGLVAPAPTRAALAVLDALRFAGPLLVAGLTALALRTGQRGPGARELRKAALLRRAAAIETAGGPPISERDVELSADERYFANALAQAEGAPAAARTLADELEREGRRRAARWSWTLPLLMAVVLAVFVAPLVASLYLPLFQIAGAVK